MLSIILFIAILFVFGNLGIFALKATWGITKILFTIIFMPLILIGMVASGLFVLALPILIIAGIAVLCLSFS